MTFSIRLGLALSLSLLISCSSTPPAEPVRYYTLDADSLEPQPARTPPIRGTLHVTRLTARGLLGGRALLYRAPDDSPEIQAYPRYLWQEPIAPAMTNLLVDQLRAAQVFTQVTATGRTQTDYRLEGEIERYEHQPLHCPPRVRASIELALIRPRDRALLWSRNYVLEEPVGERTATAMVLAFNRLALALTQQVSADLRAWSQSQSRSE